MRKALLLFAVFAGFWPSTVSAVIVAGGDGTQNNSASGTAAPWDHVGTTGGGTGVFLGNFGGNSWVLSAAHLGLGNFTLSGVTYTLVTGSEVRVLNSNNSVTDLRLFRIENGPSLPNLTLSGSRPANGESITMIGAGQGREAGLVRWDIATNPWTETASAPPGDVEGYKVSGGGGMRWGTNTIEGTTISGQNFYNVGTGATLMFFTDFDLISGEAQGSSGDSGGAVFFQNGGTWELAGIMGAVFTFDTQPAGSFILSGGAATPYGNLTAMADIAAYNGFISSAIPEPAHVTLGLGAAAVAFAAWRRTRRAR